jgi:hypothetical protein
MGIEPTWERLHARPTGFEVKERPIFRPGEFILLVLRVVLTAFPLRPGWDFLKIPDAGILSDCYDEQQFSSFICCWLETATKEMKFQWTKII